MERWRSKVGVCLLAVVLGGLATPGQAAEARRKSRGLWWASVAMVVAASALDVASSRGGVEANPLLRGQNGAFNTGRAVLIKAIGMGGMVVTEAVVLRRSPSAARSAAVVNLVTAGAVSGLAVRNLKVGPTPAVLQ
jgi:hypothetical protein